MAQASSPDPRDPPRFDPWSGKKGGGLQWFAVSGLVHVLLLVIFATVSITVIRKVEEIRVKVVEERVGVENLEGQPSLEDLTGLLSLQEAPTRQARPSGPTAPFVRNVAVPNIPKIGAVGPKLGAGPVDLNAAPLTFGSGGVGGLGGSFGDYVGGLRKVGLDLVLVIDTTESMQFVIDEVKKRATSLVKAIQRMVPTSRVGIVAYRDQGDEYVTKWTDLSFRTEKLETFLSTMSASGGGDWEEAVREGLDAAMNDLSWRKTSKKIIILIGGSPPHPEDVDQVHDLVRDFREKGGTFSAIDVTHQLHESFEKAMWKSLHGNDPYKPSELPSFYKDVGRSYAALAKDGGGELVALADDKKLIRDVLVLTFGSRWKVEMAKYLQELS
jgi:hypothetical protein